jgi:hypothetical protein
MKKSPDWNEKCPGDVNRKWKSLKKSKILGDF